MKSHRAYVIALFCVLLTPLARASGTDIRFENFGNDVVLLSEGRDEYRIRGSQQHVLLTNRIVIGAQPAFDADAFLNLKNPHLKSLKPIFKGRARIWLAEVSSTEQVPIWMERFRDNKHVLLVQPDIMLVPRPDIEQVATTQANFRSLEEDDRRDATTPYRVRALPYYWQRTRGEGVTIAVIDDGFDMQHPQLQHVRRRFEFDTELRRMGAVPMTPDDNQGTHVAGILFARQDQRAPEGIAPEAAMIGIRRPGNWTSDTVLAFHLAALAGADVINCSWKSPMLMEPVAQVIEELAKYGRNGRGLPIVFAAGDRGQLIHAMSSEPALAEVIVAAAYNQSYQRLDTSDYGPSVDFHALGQGLVSTARNNDYRAFEGSGLAAAIVTGVIALIMSTDTNISLAEIHDRLREVMPDPKR